jgi:hypothetical protein
LESAVSLTPEREQYLKEHTVIIEDITPVSPETGVLPSASVEIASEEPIKSETKQAVSAEPVPAKSAATAVKKDEVSGTSQPISKPVQTVATSNPAPSQTPSSIPEAVAPVVSSAEEAPAAEAPAVVAVEEHVSSKEVGTVKGSTTIYDMMSWGVKREEIGPAVGIELPSDNGAKLKDIITAAGKSFEELKTVLQKLVDEAK